MALPPIRPDFRWKGNVHWAIINYAEGKGTNRFFSPKAADVERLRGKRLPEKGIATMGLFRPVRRKFRFWWNNRRRWKALEVLLADPVPRSFSELQGYGNECYSLAEGKLEPISGSWKLPGYNFPFMLPGLHRDRVEIFFP